MSDLLNRTCGDLAALCRGDAQELASWLERDSWRLLYSCALWVTLGGGIYGASLGLWRSPLQASYMAVKFPVLILVTTISNGALNGMLAQLLGARISFRQSLLAITMSFAIFAIVVGSLTPLSLFIVFNLPSMQSPAAGEAYATLLVMTVFIMAAAGTVANARLFGVLNHVCGNRRRAAQILCAWLAGNLFLGCQLSWSLRPFFGTPDLPVTFLRDNPFDGNFYETLVRHAMTVLSA